MCAPVSYGTVDESGRIGEGYTLRGDDFEHAGATPGHLAVRKLSKRHRTTLRCAWPSSRARRSPETRCLRRPSMKVKRKNTTFDGNTRGGLIIAWGRAPPAQAAVPSPPAPPRRRVSGKGRPRDPRGGARAGLVDDRTLGSTTPHPPGGTAATAPPRAGRSVVRPRWACAVKLCGQNAKASKNST